MSGLKKRIACWLCPELALTESRFFKLRSELSNDRHWLGYDFPEIDVFAFRALVMDANFGRGLDDKPYPMRAGDVDWSDDIARFREQLRSRFRPTPSTPEPREK